MWLVKLEQLPPINVCAQWFFDWLIMFKSLYMSRDLIWSIVKLILKHRAEWKLKWKTSSLSMWSKVVLPQLSKPRNRILASFCDRPRDAKIPYSQSRRNISFFFETSDQDYEIKVYREQQQESTDTPRKRKGMRALLCS